MRKQLYRRLQQAYASGSLKLVRRIHALLALAQDMRVREVAEMLALGAQTVRDYRNQFLCQGVASLVDKRPPGRPSTLTKTPRKELADEQLPAYSPDFNPIEPLWKKVKKEATHLKYFPEFTDLQDEVDSALLHFAQTPHEITVLMARHCEKLGKVETAA